MLLFVDAFSLLLTKSICAYVKVGASAPVIGFWIVAAKLHIAFWANGAAAVEEHAGKSRLA